MVLVILLQKGNWYVKVSKTKVTLLPEMFNFPEKLDKFYNKVNKNLMKVVQATKWNCWYKCVTNEKSRRNFFKNVLPI